jgi:hypothetical protein
MLKMRKSLALISAVLMYVPCPASPDPLSGPTSAESARDGKLLTCFVYSLQTIPLLRQLQANIKKDPSQADTQDLIQAIGGQGKIEFALLDSEIVLNSLSKLVSEKHIIKLDEKLFDNPMWILSNELYSHAMKEKSFKEQFLETFKFTQSCIDEFMLKPPKTK